MTRFESTDGSPAEVIHGDLINEALCRQLTRSASEGEP
jgi:hypothetical protein